MAVAKEVRQGCVAGRVKVRPNKDKSITFTVAGKRGKKFILAENSGYAQTLSRARRALVRYQEGDGRNLKVTLVLAEPSGLLIRQYNADE